MNSNQPLMCDWCDGQTVATLTARTVYVDLDVKDSLMSLCDDCDAEMQDNGPLADHVLAVVTEPIAR